MEWVRVQEMMAAPKAASMLARRDGDRKTHHSAFSEPHASNSTKFHAETSPSAPSFAKEQRAYASCSGYREPGAGMHHPVGSSEPGAPRPFVLVDSNNRVRELTSTAPIRIPSTKPIPMPRRAESYSAPMHGAEVDDQGQLEQQIMMQQLEMRFHHSLPRPQPTSASVHEHRPMIFTQASTNADNTMSGPSQPFANPLKTPPTVPPVSPFAGMALSAPAKPTIGSTKTNPFLSRFTPASSVENSPRLPSLSSLRAGSPGPLKMGIAGSRPPPLQLRPGEMNSTSSGLPPPSPQTAFPSYASTSVSSAKPVPLFLSSSVTTPPPAPLYAQPATPMPTPHHSQSLPGMSYMQEQRNNRMSFDGAESVMISSEEEDNKDTAALMSSSVESRTSTSSVRSGRICRFANCNNIARSRGLCRTHGGGKRCSHPNCNKSAQANRKCIAHGGGTPCSVADCHKTAQSRGLCKAHGGGARCKHPNCPKSSQSKGLCRGHGGGIKCKEEGCEKWVQKNGYCIKHGRERAMTIG